MANDDWYEDTKMVTVINQDQETELLADKLEDDLPQKQEVAQRLIDGVVKVTQAKVAAKGTKVDWVNMPVGTIVTETPNGTYTHYPISSGPTFTVPMTGLVSGLSINTTSITTGDMIRTKPMTGTITMTPCTLTPEQRLAIRGQVMENLMPMVDKILEDAKERIENNVRASIEQILEKY
jgi:hypothetical protein